MAAKFELVSKFQPAGDQPQAIDKLVAGLREGKRTQTLLGATGTGKTFTAANVIAQLGKPTLVLSHNKTLAAQLYKEFKGFFPHNAVHYFVSYYDYYQPEAYIPQRDIYIEKDALDQREHRPPAPGRHQRPGQPRGRRSSSPACRASTASARPTDYKRDDGPPRQGRDRSTATSCCCKLVDIQYQRNDIAFERGKFRVRGDVIEVWPASEEFGLRIELFGDEVDAPGDHQPDHRRDAARRSTSCTSTRPSTSSRRRSASSEAVEGIEQELDERLEQFKTEGKLLEAQRLAARTRFDMEMLLEVGYCPGIENYARWFSGRKPGEPPYTLHRLLPRRLPDGRRRVARHAAAGARHVRRRPQPQD